MFLPLLASMDSESLVAFSGTGRRLGGDMSAPDLSLPPRSSAMSPVVVSPQGLQAEASSVDLTADTFEEDDVGKTPEEDPDDS